MALGLQLRVGAGGIITRGSASGSLFCQVVKDTQQWKKRKLHHSGNVLPLLTIQNPQEPPEGIRCRALAFGSPFCFSYLLQPGSCHGRDWVGLAAAGRV